jgi:hypothetical protein
VQPGAGKQQLPLPEQEENVSSLLLVSLEEAFLMPPRVKLGLVKHFA